MNNQFYLFHNFVPIIIISFQIVIILCYDHRHTNNNNKNTILTNRLYYSNSKMIYSQHQIDKNNNIINIKSNYDKRGLLQKTSLRASSDGNYNGMSGKKPKQRGNNNDNNNDEWLEDNDDSIYIRLNEDNNLPSIDNNIYNALDQTLGEMITVSAIDTLSYYMIEFHDDDTQRWMVSFKNYKTKGFKSNKVNNNDKNNKNDDNIDNNSKLSWQSYLEDMIKLDTQYFKVYVDPPRVASRLKDIKMKDKNLKVMYIDEIQPRKIAHRLISVREDVSNEVLVDLG